MKKILILLLMLVILSYSYGQDILLSDFEQSTYVWLPTGGAWTATGDCFGSGPKASPSGVTGYLGSKLVYTKLTSDDNAGTLTSPSFTITRKYIRFLIGGGNWRPQTTINLIVGGQVVRSSVGMGDREALDWLQWNVSGLLNQTAQIQIVDNAGTNVSGDWRHLNVDHIIATDVCMSGVIVPSKKYLLLPVKTGATKQLIELVQEGMVVREIWVELSTTPDYWAFIEMAPYTGKELVVRVNSILATSTQLTNYFVQSDVITAATPIYQETLRPIYHYTAKRGFISDPNDLVYKDGEYHLGYQHNAFGWGWENMTHGHAVSTDLVRWTELPDAITETYWGEAWNGSSVVDANNTAGFGSGAIVTIYTGAAGWADNPRMAARNKFTQPLAYSTDNGRTFNHYENNPVVPWIYGSNHDPVIFWYAPGNKWVMLLYVGDGGGYHIYNSTNLKNWTYASAVNISQTTEVPDLFELPVDGNTSNKKWVFSCGYRQYIIGTFDGSTFTQEAGPFWYGWQKWDLAAALTFNNTPDGRRIMVTNGRTEFPGMPFNRYLNLPSELTLKTIGGAPKLHFNPVAEVTNLRTSTQTWGAQTLNTGVNLMNGLSGEGVEIEIVFKPNGTRSQMEFAVGEFVLAYNAGQGGKVGFGGQWRSLQPMADGTVHIRAFYDRGVWEVYANNGQFYMPREITVKAGTWPLSLITKNAPIDIVSLSLHHMGSCWGSGGGGTVTVPNAPGNLGATAMSSSQISLTWTDNSSNEDGFTLERATNSSFSQNLVSTAFGANVTSYSATGLSASTAYYFRVRASNSAGSSAWSNTAGATTQSDGGGGSATTMHVYSIVKGEVNAGAGNKRGSATVTIHDNLGNAVSSATVTGTFSGDFNETKSGTTSSNGSVTLVTDGMKKGSLNFLFCVDNVTHSTLTYDAGQNVLTCSDATKSVSIIGDFTEQFPLFYPNPVTGSYFMIDRNIFEEKELLITLFNLSGQAVFKQILFDGENLIDLSDDLPNGIYQIVIKGNETTHNGRMLIMAK